MTLNLMTLKLAWQQLLAHFKAGELQVLLFALVLAVASTVAVSMFTQRVALHLNTQGGLLLGGDMVVMSDKPIAQSYTKTAQDLGLQTTHTLEFPSMIVQGELNQLAEIKALGLGFPLRGDFSVRMKNSIQTIATTPSLGEAWAEPRLMTLLNLKLGDVIDVGETKLTITAVLEREPSRGGDMFSFAPRLMMNADDVAKTKLIQFGSRVKYQLLAAGDSKKITILNQILTPQLKRGERLQDVKTARPEIKSALDKAETFLGLSSMVSVTLAVIAMLLASTPFLAMQLDTFAMLRCFGASQARLQQILLTQIGLLALIGGALGAVLGFALQFGLAHLAGKLFVESLPQASFSTIGLGFLVSFMVLFAICWPQWWSVKRMPAIRMLQRDTAPNLTVLKWQFLPIIVVMVVLACWQAKTLKLGLSFSLGLLVLCGLIAVCAWGLVKLISVIKQSFKLNGALAIGLGNVAQHLKLSLTQMVTFGVGGMALLLLALVQADLLNTWQKSLPANAPNRFVINIQPDQVKSMSQFMAQNQLQQAQFFPMVRGRLVAINQKTVNPDAFEDERAQRLASREFNLSMVAQMQSDNKLLQGRWWGADDAGKPYVSLEVDIAQALNIQLNDVLTYDIAGEKIALTVTSIRKVEWDSMRANFFAVTPPKVLDKFSKSYMTAFYLSQQDNNKINGLIKTHPNLTVIDVAAIMTQVRLMMHKMGLAVGYVFLLSVLAGMAVLTAALVATRESRIRETTLMRVMGASRAQVRTSILVEFACIGAVAATVAIIVASSLAYYLSQFVLDIPYQFNASLALITLILSLILVPLAAWLLIRSYLNVPPKQLLNSV